MPIVLNTNSAATEATFNLSKANDNLRRSIARLSSGNRITKPTDDAGGLAVAYKLQSSVKRTEASLNNHQNALSFLQVQDGVLEAMGDIVDRMSELRTMAADVSKNAADVENYSKEFLELQDQLAQMKREKFNGVELFAVENEQDAMKGINKSHLIVNGELHDNVNGKTYANKAEYEYFDDPLVEKRTKSSFDKYEFQLYTNPSGVEEDGNIKLNIVNLQFMLGLKDPGSFGRINDISALDTAANGGDGNSTIDTATEWRNSGFDTDGDGVIDADELSSSGLDKGDGTISEGASSEWANSGYDTGDGNIDAAELTSSGFDLGDGAISEGANSEWANSRYDTDGNGSINGTELADSGLDLNGDGTINNAEALLSGIDTPDGNLSTEEALLSGIDTPDGTISTAEARIAPFYAAGSGNTIEVGESVNLAGLNQPKLPGTSSGAGINYEAMLTDENGDGYDGDGYVKDITKISIEEFTNIIEKIADVRAENGAEQQRVNQSLKLQQTNLVNLEAAHGRIMDVDVALESTRLARHSVTVQASAAMVAQANQMTSVALTLLS
jgi:flagellin-like hook-associated protein FlgL